MTAHKWICSCCKGAYILPRHSRHENLHWRCYSCGETFNSPLEVADGGFDQYLTSVQRPENWTAVVEGYSGPYNFPADRVIYPERPHAEGSGDSPKKKRTRATVVAVQDGHILLVQENGRRRFSLPGGGLKKGESVLQGALRELKEETNLEAVKAEYLFDHESSTQSHKVVLATVLGSVHLQPKEIAGYRWWNTSEDVPLVESTIEIVGRFKQLHSQRVSRLDEVAGYRDCP